MLPIRERLIAMVNYYMSIVTVKALSWQWIFPYSPTLLPTFISMDSVQIFVLEYVQFLPIFIQRVLKIWREKCIIVVKGQLCNYCYAIVDMMRHGVGGLLQFV
ncbi:hypothetical protein GQX74_010336 [Glossina fuscipes]|nr:hypothetical protein GQX74_010336 [Glossina fuscipes]